MTHEKWHPGSLLQLSGNFWKTGTLHAAVKLDVFTVINDRSLEAGEIAEKAGSAPDATARLLDALVAMGLLFKEGGFYTNSDASRDFLSKTSPGYIGYMILHHHHLVDLWRRLDQSVRTGGPVPETGGGEGDEAEREAFLMGMFNMASMTAPDLVKQVDLGGRRRLLDMGGGPGTYAIHFCLKYPDLAATVFDLETTRPFAEKTIERFGLSGRIGFEGGSYLDRDLPDGYDAVWMSHILHGESFRDCMGMMKKAWKAMEPGGMIAVHEFILDETRTEPLFAALFSLNMLVATEAGRAYTEQEITDMLKKAGFTEIRRLPWSGPAESGVITAVK